MDLDFYMINGSVDRTIDLFRSDLKSYASTVSFSGGRKILLIDEADHLTSDHFQPALRGFMEEFSVNCGFILTCNYENKIIPAIHTRSSVINFKITKPELPQLANEFLVRVKTILETEDITYDEKVVAELIMKYVPDWRRVLNELQRYGASGTIDVGILTDYSQVNIENLCKYLKEKNFGNIRKWVTNNLDNDPHTLYRQIYDILVTKLVPGSVPNAVLIIADYVYKSSFVVDQEINMIACLTELMGSCEFK